MRVSNLAQMCFGLAALPPMGALLYGLSLLPLAGRLFFGTAVLVVLGCAADAIAEKRHAEKQRKIISEAR